MKVYKKLFRYVPKEKYLGIVAILCSLLSSFITTYGLYSIYRFLEALIVSKDTDLAQSFAVRTVVALTTGVLVYLLSGLFAHLLGFRLETMLRKRGIEGLTQASFRFFDLNPSGKTRKIIDDNAEQTHMIVAHLIPDNSQAFLGPFFTIGLGFMISIKVGIALIVLAILCAVAMGFMMGEQKFLKTYQEALQTLSAQSVEYVRGMPVIKIFGAGVSSFQALHKAIVDYSRYAYDYSNSCRKPYVAYQWFFFGLMAILAIPISLFIGKIDNPDVFALELIMLIFLSGVLMVSFMRIMWVSMYMFKANYAVDTLENLFEKMLEDRLSFGTETEFVDYNIEFDNVTFGYNKKNVIENLSFRLEEGKSYALVGSSGSGKTTIAKLISGFYKVDGGAIKIGGKPIESYSDESLIKAISFVFQDAKLFKKTIYENVALANKNATREEVLRALHLAGCDSILNKLPNRVETLIGSKGIYLSGGEKQRIAIARAILKDSKIIIMDEASAAIDPDNEHELQKAFKNLIQGKTVIMIAHRLSSIRSVDEILVLEDGKVIERGTDRELMNSGSKYKELQELYNSANEWRVGYETVL